MRYKIGRLSVRFYSFLQHGIAVRETKDEVFRCESILFAISSGRQFLASNVFDFYEYGSAAVVLLSETKESKRLL